jgi:hypothetical protein
MLSRRRNGNSRGDCAACDDMRTDAWDGYAAQVTSVTVGPYAVRAGQPVCKQSER